MKKRRFLAYIAAIVASVSVVVGCSDNNEPPFEPTQNPSYNDTIIVVDERIPGQQLDGGCAMEFANESLDGFRVIKTYNKTGVNYEIYIPVNGAELDLVASEEYFWIYPVESFKVNSNQVDLKIDMGDKMENYWYDDYNDQHFNYFYQASNDYITIIYDTKDVLRYRIPANKSGIEMRIETSVNNPPLCDSGANIIFIQAAK